MLRYCAIHRDTSGNWKLDRLQKFEWSEWQDGLVQLLRKTLFQRFLRGSRAMTIKFYQTPLFCLDQLKPSMLKRLHQAFLASP
jgi:hypothetical protein